MRLNLIFSIIAFAACSFFVACDRTDVKSPGDFSVSASKDTFKVGDTIVFNLKGTPDEVVFYSGEIGMRYDYVNRNTDTSGVAKLVFQTSIQKGTLVNNDSLRLMISPDLNGYDSASVVKATWFDITSRNTKWPTTVATTYVTSDSINLSDFKSYDNVNIAFRFIGKNSGSNAQQMWRMQGFSLIRYLTDGTKCALFAAPQIAAGPTVSDFKYTGWVQTSLKNNTLPGYNAWNVGSAGISTANSVKNTNGVTITAAYPITFDPGTTVSNPDNDDWLITSKVNLKQIKPDFGVTIKNAIGVSLTTFKALPAQYYKTPGKYKVTFVAINQNISSTQKIVKQLNIVVK